MLRRLCFVGIVLALAAPAYAGVVNPDISVIGQPFVRWTDDAADPARQRVTMDVGETEFVFDAYLNPYARGTFVASLGEEGLELEEGYFVLTRGLPGGMSLKGGKYRAGFGRLNPAHPHTYPFFDRFRVLRAYLPGDESLNDLGIQLSELVPIGDLALTAAADWLQGDAFRLERVPTLDPDDLFAIDGDRGDEPRPAGLGRLSMFVPLHGQSALELGVSGTHGTNNVAAATRTTVFGGDVKAKLWTNERSYVVLQGEVLSLDREDAGWDTLANAYTKTSVTPIGGYFFADYNWNTRYNAGASYEVFQEPTSGETTDQAFGVFAGLALMEETTVFRIGYERFMPGRPSGSAEAPDAVNTVTLKVVYSMGPHKAHQF
jgi:hypothetical protein